MGILNSHATNKYYERSNVNIGKKEITKALKNRANIEFIKRSTESRSMVYIKCSSGIIKAIINRKTMSVITILPWKEEYKEVIFYTHTKYDKRYKITLYPDCYLETNNNKHLTKISRISLTDDATELETIERNHPHFDYLFACAWRIYKSGE